MMGKIVLVDRVYRRDWENIKDGTRKTWHVADAEGRPGWVVGERWLHDGVADYDPEHGYAWTSRGVSHHHFLRKGTAAFKQRGNCGKEYPG